MDIYQLSERDICMKLITPALQQASWEQHQFREEVNLTAGRIMVRGKLAARIRNPDVKGHPKRADFVSSLAQTFRLQSSKLSKPSSR